MHFSCIDSCPKKTTMYVMDVDSVWNLKSILDNTPNILGMSSVISSLTLEVIKILVVFSENKFRCLAWSSRMLIVSYHYIVEIIEVIAAIWKRKFIVRKLEVFIHESFSKDKLIVIMAVTLIEITLLCLRKNQNKYKRQNDKRQSYHFTNYYNFDIDNSYSMRQYHVLWVRLPYSWTLLFSDLEFIY